MELRKALEKSSGAALGAWEVGHMQDLQEEVYGKIFVSKDLTSLRYFPRG